MPGIIGLNIAKKVLRNGYDRHAQIGKTCSIVGIVISAITTVILIIALIVLFVWFGSLMASESNSLANISNDIAASGSGMIGI